MADISWSGEVGVRAFRSGLLELRWKFLLETGREAGRPSVLYPDPSNGSVAKRESVVVFTRTYSIDAIL